jgi:hypothetical protein
MKKKISKRAKIEQKEVEVEEEIPEIPKNLLPVFITAGSVDSTLCGWVYFHDTNKKEIEEEEEEGKEILKPIFASKSHIGAINCTDSFGKEF